LIQSLRSTDPAIHPSVQHGNNIRLGQNVTIEANVRIGDNCILDSNAYIGHSTTIGNDCHLFPGAVVGTAPQDLHYKEEDNGRTVLGNNVQVREYATIHRATGKDAETVMGDRCFLMAYSHVGHNCQLGQDVILANNVHLGGYVQIGDYTTIGGMVVVHQFVRIGRMVMIGGFGAVRQDLPPFCLAEGAKVGLKGLNSIGIKRRGIELKDRILLKEAYKLLWFQGKAQTEALEIIMNQYPNEPLIQELVDFVTASKRGIRKPHRLIPSEKPVDGLTALG
jgi:UDP-N-acetylglucosamine acyltransferase